MWKKIFGIKEIRRNFTLENVRKGLDIITYTSRYNYNDYLFKLAKVLTITKYVPSQVD